MCKFSVSDMMMLRWMLYHAAHKNLICYKTITRCPTFSSRMAPCAQCGLICPTYKQFHPTYTLYHMLVNCHCSIQDSVFWVLLWTTGTSKKRKQTCKFRNSFVVKFSVSQPSKSCANFYCLLSNYIRMWCQPVCMHVLFVSQHGQGNISRSWDQCIAFIFTRDAHFLYSCILCGGA